MMDIGLRPVADGRAAARHLRMPVAARAGKRCEAFVRDCEAWLSYDTPAGQAWLITAAAGSDLHLPGDLEGSALIVAGIVGIGSTDPFGPSAPAWHPGGRTSDCVVGADRFVYATYGEKTVVVAAVPAAAAPPPSFEWITSTPSR